MADPTIGVVVASFGSDEWRDRGRAVALPSVRAQSDPPDDIVVVHEPDGTLAAVRNRAVAELKAAHVIVCDADDELSPGYVAAMRRSLSEVGGGPCLHQPATLGVYADGRTDDEPVLIPQKGSLLEGNWLVVGSMFQRDQFLRLGGFSDRWEVAEDWELFIRMWLDGAAFVTVPEAVYRVAVSDAGRNRGDRALFVRTYRAVRQLHLPEARARGLV